MVKCVVKNVKIRLGGVVVIGVVELVIVAKLVGYKVRLD